MTGSAEHTKYLESDFDIWIVLFIAAAAQGIFLSAMLWVKQAGKKHRSQHLLAALILAFTITLSYYIAYWLKVDDQLAKPFRVIMLFTLLFGPLSWTYLFRTLHNRLPKLAWLHFIPFVPISLLALYGGEAVKGMEVHFNVFQIVHLLIYAIANLVLVQRRGKNQWARNVALSFSGYVLCFMAYYLLSWTGILSDQHDYMVSFGMSIFIYFIGYHGFRAPTFFNGPGNEKYQNSSLTDSSIDYIAQKLDALMEQEKLYTKGDLKLQEVADRLDLGTHALSQAINVAKGKKFTDYLNELRVEEAIRLMKSLEYQHVKLLAIALDAGFNNKTSFLNAFKKYTGQSPSEYRKNMAA